MAIKVKKRGEGRREGEEGRVVPKMGSPQKGPSPLLPTRSKKIRSRI